MNIDIKIVLGFLSAVVVFIFAIDSFSKEIMNENSVKMRSIISKLVKNRLVATIIGAISTALVHSSSAMTSVIVTLVSMGFIPFKHSLGLIIGANIGTTFTAMMALLDSSLIAPTLIVIGFALQLFGKKYKFLSKSIFFLGFILFSLNTLSTAISPLRSNREIVKIFTELQNPIIAILVSIVFTMLIQSSSITMGILIVLGQAGFLKTDIAVAMIIGANIGSSLTSVIVSLKLDVFAKRTALGNFLFNFFGSIICFIFLDQFILLVSSVSYSVPIRTALAHFLFNFLNAIIFLIFLTPFSKLIENIIKSTEEEIVYKTKFIINGKQKNLKKRFENVKNELLYSISVTIKIFNIGISLNEKYKSSKIIQIDKLENLNDFLDGEISTELIKLTNKKLSSRLASEGINLIKMSNALEQLGDLGRDYARIFIKIHESDSEKNLFDVTKIYNIHESCMKLFENLGKLFEEKTEELFSSQKLLEKSIEAEIDRAMKSHLQKISEAGSYDASLFVDALSILELAVAKSRTIRHIIL